MGRLTFLVSATIVVVIMMVSVVLIHRYQLKANTQRSAASDILDELAQVTLDNIERVVQPAIKRASLLAESTVFIDALRRSDEQRLAELADDAVQHATEIDVVAVFDCDGDIVAINRVYSDGAPVDPVRVHSVLERSFDECTVVQSCVKNAAREGVLEFQTACDITPAYFDSSGLAVAYSAPVWGDSHEVPLGVISVRLRFDRLINLLGDGRLAGGSSRLHFVSDRGEFFDEQVNGGETPAPIPSQELVHLLAPLVQGTASEQYLRVHRGADSLSIVYIAWIG